MTGNPYWPTWKPMLKKLFKPTLMDEEKYIKLFNYGYFLSKNEPKILEKLLQSTKENAQMHDPIKAGDAEYKRELYRAADERTIKRKFPGSGV